MIQGNTMHKNMAVLTIVLFSFAVFSVPVGLIEIGLLFVSDEFVASDDPKVIASQISEVIVPAAQMVIASPILASIGTVILLFNNYRARWYFWCCLVFSFPYVLLFPLGTILFVVVWTFVFLKKSEFLRNTKTT